MARSRQLAIGGVCGVLLLGGCGSDAEKPATDAASATTTSSIAPVTTTSAAPTTTTMAVTTTTAVKVTAPPTTRLAAVAVTVKQFQFTPAELVVRTGTKVTWTNQDDILHTATSGATPGTPDGKFDGTMDGAGKSYSFTFDQPGTYPYFCSRHNSMTGKVLVQ